LCQIANITKLEKKTLDFRNYPFEMSKFKKIISEGKIQKLVEIQEPLASGPATCRASIQ
jgi:hypothetical protein